MATPVAGFNVNPQNINREGRPMEPWTWRGLLMEAAEEVAEGSKEPRKKILARKLVEKAADGDVTALKEFGDRIDGKANQAVELSGKDGGPVEQSITITFVKPDGA